MRGMVLIVTIGCSGKIFSPAVDKMISLCYTCEPIHVSVRFRRAMESAILGLEAGAARDERILPAIGDADHRRRQLLLVNRQLERAFRLRELLARTVLRSERVDSV